MTVAANFAVPFKSASDCSDYLNRWSGTADLETLLSKNGPLSGEVINSKSFVSLEMNYQLQTWPSSVAQGMGAFAEYIFRVYSFVPGGTGMTAVPKLLHNSIDTAKIKNSGSLRDELKQFLADHALEVARGTVNLPEKFLAESASSYTPNGLSRLSNRPFSQVYKAGDFSGISFPSTKYISSAEELKVRPAGLPANVGKPWNAEAEQMLSELFAEGIAVSEIASLLQRKPGGVRARLVKMGLLIDPALALLPY